MAIVGNSRIFIEPDGQYTTLTIYRDDTTEGDTLITPALNQTLTAAFNKARDDLATLLTGGVTAKSITINLRAE